MLKKIISSILTVLLIMQILPMSVFAEELNEEELTAPNYSTEIGDSYIIGEDISLRDETTKHFRCSDGRYIAATYGYPVHYEKDGKWEELDFSLSETVTENGNTVFSTKSEQNYKISVPEDIYSDAISYSYNGYEISLTYQGRANQGQENKTKKAKIEKKNNKKNKKLSHNNASAKDYNNNYMLLENSGSTVLYENVEPDTSFSYSISSVGIKEDIIVESPQNNYKYSYILETGSLVPSVESDNTIILTDTETNNVVYYIEAPIMYDNAGEESTDIEIKLKEKQGKYELIIEADKQWINSSEREFPITIDPTVKPNISRSQIDDTYVNQAQPTIPQHNSTDLYVGRNSLGLTRTYIKFDLPALSETSIIVNAAFYMYLRECDIGTSGAVMNIYDLTGLPEWSSSTVTWNNQPVSNAENGISDLTVIDYCDYGSNVGYPYSWDITKIAQNWRETGENNGMLIAPSDESKGPLRVRFLSSESTIASAAGIPQLLVSYRDTHGLEDYWSYTSYNVGDAGTAYINDYTGNLVFVRNDTSTYGQRMPVSISHIYDLANANLQSGYSPSSGKGWKLSVQQSVISTPDDDNFSSELHENYPYIYKDGDGTDHYFTKNTNTNNWEDEDGLGLILTINSSSTSARYTIKDNNDNIMTFDSNGNIQSIEDANENSIVMTYSGTTLTKVTDGAGHNITITTGTNSLTQTAPDSRTSVHTYSSGKLSSVKLTNGKNVSYTYDSAGRMLTATASDGYKIKFTYKTSGQSVRVSNVELYSGSTKIQSSNRIYNHNEITIEHSGNTASISDSTKITTVKQFDDFGRLISTYEKTADDFLGAANCAYVAHEKETDDAKHHVSTVGELGDSVSNLLQDPSFERNNSAWVKTANIAAPSSATNSTSVALYGKTSRKIYVQSYTADAQYRTFQNLNLNLLTAGETYTASVYVKIDSCAAASNGGVFLQARCESSNTSLSKSNYSEYLTAKTDTNINNGWQKLSVTFTVPTGVTKCYVAFGFINATGTAYFDGVQVEKGTVANDFNLIENSGFEHGDKIWTHPSSSSDGHFNSNPHLGSLSYRLYGKPFATQEITQTINLESVAKETDTYVFSAWAKADSLSNQFHVDGRDKKFGIGVKITFTDNTVVDRYIPGNFAVSDWQFISGAFTLSDGTDTAKTPKTLTVYGIYKNQSNKVNFDDFSLAKEDVPSYTYNSKGNLVSAVDNAKGNQQMSYSANGVDMTEYRDAVSDVYTYTYDNKHNLTSATSTRGVKYNYTYNGAGNVTNLSVSGDGIAETINSSITYKDFSSLVSTTTDAAGGITTYNYLPNTDIVSSVKDAKNSTTTYSYDTSNYNLLNVQATYTQKANMTETATKTAKAVYTYDSNNRLINIKAKSNYSFTYDSLGNLTTAKAGDNLLVTNTYNQNSGLLTQADYGNGCLLKYVYDTAGRLTRLKNTGGNIGTWEYDGKNRISVYNDLANSQKHLFSYDALGRFNRESVLDTSTNSRIYASEYGYDRNNNVNKIGVVAGNTGVSMTYTYDTDNLPSGYTANTNTGSYTYDKLNRLKTKTSSITPTVSYNYKNGTSMISQEIFNGAITTHTYDANGNITMLMTGDKKIEYQYDELNRIVAECNEYTGQTTVYKYDAWGNIAMKWLYTGTDTFSPDSSNLVKKYDYVYLSSTEGMAWKDLLTKYDGKTITYDEIANPTSYMGSSMTWEGRTLVEQIKNGTTITYSYDSSNMRTSKTVGGVKHNYYYVEGKLMYEDCPSYKLFYAYDANGFLSGIKRVKSNGTTENYGVYCNMFGDVIAIYNSSKALIAKYSYDTWGKLLSITNASGTDISATSDIWTQNSIRYRGYVYDEETQLYYLQSRYYDATTGRFINADDYSLLTVSPTALTDKNLFAYCDCNPIVRIDIGGNVWETIVDVISLGASAVEVYINPTDPWAWAGLVGDVIDIVPVVTGVGETIKAVKIINRTTDVADAINDTHKGWKLGDNVTKLTKAGNKPSWSTIRNRYWKNEALLNSHKYTDPKDIDLMKKGRAPIGYDSKPMELHHPLGREKGDNLFIFYPMHHTDHMLFHYGR